jgi:hypothetical protein
LPFLELNNFLFTEQTYQNIPVHRTSVFVWRKISTKMSGPLTT